MLLLLGVWVRETRLTLRERLEYLMSLPMVAAGRVRYCGSWFSSDNKLGLLLLPEYIPLVAAVLDRVSELTGADAEAMRVVDVGANVGQFSAAALRLGVRDVIAIEPNPVAFEHLERNIQSRTGITLCRTAISTDPELMLWFVPGKSAQGSRYAENSAEHLLGAPEPTSVLVGARLLDTELVPDSPLVTVVKVDVEGAELDVIAAMRIMPAFVMLEVSPGRNGGCSEQDLADALDLRFGVTPRVSWDDRAGHSNVAAGSAMWNVLFDLRANDQLLD